VSGGIDRTLWIAAGCCALITLIGLIVLWPTGSVPTSLDTSSLNGDRVEAVVASTSSAPCSYDPISECREVTIQITSGPHKGSESTWEQGPDSGTPTVHADDDIYVYQTVRDDGSVSYEFADFERSSPLFVLGLIFVGAVVLLARWKGLGAIGGLAASLLVLVVFMLPAILRGENAIAVALVGSSVIAFIALYLAHGVNISTTVALLSTFLSLALIGVLSWVFVTASQFSGRTEDSTYFLTALGVQIDARGLLLAGIVIGSLGVLDDVTVTQVSAVWELRQAQPEPRPARSTGPRSTSDATTSPPP